MPELHAFRGLRYDLGHVGSLRDVVAPPYDVIDPELQDRLYKQHPANVIRLILNREEPGDDNPQAPYRRAARLLKNWTGEGVLRRDPDPALYVYHQEFQHGGQSFTRRGFMGRVRLEPFGQGRIYPHEETHAAAKADRLNLTRHCQANLSQIFGLYPDPENEAQHYLEDAILGVAPLEATDHLGVVHRLWPVTDVRTIGQVATCLASKPVFVADGHHRYETACNYRDELAAQRPLGADHPAQFVLMMCVGMSDPGMVVLPTHRLVTGLPPVNSTTLLSQLAPFFSTTVAGQGPAAAHSVWDRIEQQDDQGTIGLYAAADQRWVLARIAPAGRNRMAELAAEHCAEWQQLGVAILHRLILQELLDGAKLPKPTYVHQVSEVVHELEAASGEGSPYALAALVMPATLEDIRGISEHGERMPAKSTYFYPKLLSGLVINLLV